MPKNNELPYKAFGSKIKYIRKQWKQTIGEVSSTLEIDETLLKDIESGRTLPTETLLEMIINHFVLSDDQSIELRQMANYHKDQQTENLLGGIEDMLMKQIVMYMPVDQKVVYTDGMNVTVNQHGVVLQFTQNQGPKTKNLNVSQVGMSIEHAQKIVEVLSKTLDEHKKGKSSKMLPSPNNDNNNKPKTV